jgi:hypothetical protein
MAAHEKRPEIDVLCTGNAVERGHMQGVAISETIRESADAIHQLEAFRLQCPWWLPFRLFVKVAERKAETALRSGLIRELPEAWARLQAMSRGSGVSVRRLALLNALEPVLSDLSGCVTGLEAGCSAVAVGTDRSGGHGPILAHNFDYLPVVQKFYCIRDERPEHGFRSLQFSMAPMVGMVDGINETGLAVTLNYAYATDKDRPAPTISMRLGEALASCRTVQEASDYLTSKSRWGSGLIMLADAAGATASLELTPTRHYVRAGSRRSVLSHANRVCGQPTSEVQVGMGAVYGKRASHVLRGQRVHLSSESRELALHNIETIDSPIDPDTLAMRMADHGPTGSPSGLTLCVHSDYWHTTACIQLLPETRRLRISYSTACQAEYAEFTLGGTGCLQPVSRSDRR